MNEPVIGTEGLGQALRRHPLLEGLHVGHVAVLAAASLVQLLLALTAFSCRDVAV